MKNLYLVRHAKSSWKDFEILSDFERPLNKRGKRDAPFMGNILLKMGILPELLLSSPAQRARSTAIEIAKAINYPIDNIQYKAAIYEASIYELIDIVQNLPEQYQSAMLFGHNPAFTILANIYSDKPIENLPTCGILAIQFEVDTWAAAKAETAQLLWFEYPKLYLE